MRKEDIILEMRKEEIQYFTNHARQTNDFRNWIPAGMDMVVIVERSRLEWMGPHHAWSARLFIILLSDTMHVALEFHHEDFTHNTATTSLGTSTTTICPLISYVDKYQIMI